MRHVAHQIKELMKKKQLLSLQDIIKENMRYPPESQKILSQQC